MWMSMRIYRVTYTSDKRDDDSACDSSKSLTDRSSRMQRVSSAKAEVISRYEFLKQWLLKAERIISFLSFCTSLYNVLEV